MSLEPLACFCGSQEPETCITDDHRALKHEYLVRGASTLGLRPPPGRIRQGSAARQSAHTLMHTHIHACIPRHDHTDLSVHTQIHAHTLLQTIHSDTTYTHSPTHTFTQEQADHDHSLDRGCQTSAHRHPARCAQDQPCPRRHTRCRG